MEDKRKLLVKEFYEKLIYTKPIREIEFDEAINTIIEKGYKTICWTLEGIGSKDKIYRDVLSKYLNKLITKHR